MILITGMIVLQVKTVPLLRSRKKTVMGSTAWENG